MAITIQVSAEAAAIISIFTILLTIIAIYVLFYILRSRQKLVPNRPQSATYSKRPPTLVYYPGNYNLNPNTRSRSSSIHNSRIPRSYIARVGQKIRSRSYSPIRVSPSRPIIFGEKGEEDNCIKVTLMVTPPTPGKNLAQQVDDEDDELDSLWHGVSEFGALEDRVEDESKVART